MNSYNNTPSLSASQSTDPSPLPPASGRCFHCPACKAQIQAMNFGQLAGIRDKKRHKRNVELGLEKSATSGMKPNPTTMLGEWDDAKYRNPDGTVNDEGLKYSHAYNRALDYHWDDINKQQTANRAFRRNMNPEQAQQFQAMQAWEDLPEKQRLATPQPDIPEMPGINVRAGGTHPITGGELPPQTARVAAPTDMELLPYVRPMLDRIGRFDEGNEENETWLGNYMPNSPVPAKEFAKQYYGNRMEGLLGNFLDTGIKAEHARGNSMHLAQRLGITNLQTPSQITSQTLPRFISGIQGRPLENEELDKLEKKVRGSKRTYNDGGWKERSLAEIAQARQEGHAHYAGIDYNHGFGTNPKTHLEDPAMGPKALHRFPTNHALAHQAMSVFQKNYGNDVDAFFARHNSQEDLASSLEGLPGFSRKLSTLAAYNYGRGIMQFPRSGSDDAERAQRWQSDGDTPHDEHYNKQTPRLGMQEGMGHANSLLAHRAFGNLVNRIGLGDEKGGFGEAAAQEYLGPHRETIRAHGFQSGKTAQGTFTSKVDCPTANPNCNKCELRDHCKARASGKDVSLIHYMDNDKSTDNSKTGAMMGRFVSGHMPSAVTPTGEMIGDEAHLGTQNVTNAKKQKLGSHIDDPLSPGVSSTMAMSLRASRRGGFFASLFKAKTNGDLPAWMGKMENGAFVGSSKSPRQQTNPPPPPTTPSSPDPVQQALKLPEDKLPDAPSATPDAPAPKKPATPGAKKPAASRALAGKLGGVAGPQPTTIQPERPAQPPAMPPPPEPRAGRSLADALRGAHTARPTSRTPSIGAALSTAAAPPVAPSLPGGGLSGAIAYKLRNAQNVAQQARPAFNPRTSRMGATPTGAGFHANPVAARLRAAAASGATGAGFHARVGTPTGGPAKMGITKTTPTPLAGTPGDMNPHSPPRMGYSQPVAPASYNPRGPQAALNHRPILPKLTGPGAATGPTMGVTGPSAPRGPNNPVPPRPQPKSKSPGLGDRLRSLLMGGKWQGGDAIQNNGVTLNNWQMDALRNNRFSQRPGGLTDRLKGEKWKTDISPSEPGQRPRPDARVQLSDNMGQTLKTHELQRKQVGTLTQFARRLREGANGHPVGSMGNYNYRMASRNGEVNVNVPNPTQGRDDAGKFGVLPPIHETRNPITSGKQGQGNNFGRVGASRLPLAYRQYNKR